MPSTILFRPELIDKIITVGRLDSYKAVFSPNDDLELVGAYLWNSQVSAAFYPLFGAAEIALRNSIDFALTSYLGRWWWKTQPVVLKYKTFPHAPPDDVVKLRANMQKATSKVKREKWDRYQSTSAPTHAEVIAKTEFSTWELILSNEFKGNSLIWPKLLGSVFKGSWNGMAPNQFLSHVRDTVGNVRQYRNRLFHHEPSWKRSGIHNATDAVQFLNTRIDMISELINLIHPEKVRLLERNGLLRAARVACTERELRRFQQLAQQSRVKSGRRLADIARECSKNNGIANIRIAGTGGRRFLLIPS